ncbi:hypothetical protein EGW08_023549 [Elysia chlorotica]|uniref:Uncharacterized protein n=1 Tax=Elysia chlorotica TaxID=188477 RepID=A0A433SID7_ELYCH|nr:hypothetical protein EGW08_023549 [Elysia chlorotica]
MSWHNNEPWVQGELDYGGSGDAFDNPESGYKDILRGYGSSGMDSQAGPGDARILGERRAPNNNFRDDRSYDYNRSNDVDIGFKIARGDQGAYGAVEPKLVLRFCLAGLDEEAGRKAIETGPPKNLETAVERVRWFQQVEFASRKSSLYDDYGTDYSRCGGFSHYLVDKDYQRDSDGQEHQYRGLWSEEGRTVSPNFREHRTRDYSPAVCDVGRGVESPLETLMKTNLVQEVKGSGNSMESESKAPVTMDGCLQVKDSKVQTLERARRGSLSQSPRRRSPSHVESRLPFPKSASLSSNHDVLEIMVGDEDDRCRPKIKVQVSIFSGKCMGSREVMAGVMRRGDEDDRYRPKIKGQASIFSGKVLGSRENMPGSRVGDKDGRGRSNLLEVIPKQVDSSNIFSGLENDDGRYRPKLER